MNWGATISILLAGLVLSLKVVPKIFYMMESIELHQARIREVEIVNKHGKQWVGASPDHYTYIPKR